jgi:1-phosphatidylinositol phosphodiesterase
MRDLDNKQLVSELSIPGTHNTVALYGTDLARCQSKPLGEQLRMGIRFLDLRVKLKKHRLRMYHGIVYQRIDFAEVVDTMI